MERRMRGQLYDVTNGLIITYGGSRAMRPPFAHGVQSTPNYIAISQAIYNIIDQAARAGLGFLIL